MKKSKISQINYSARSTESPRDAALRILKIRGEMTVVELTRALGITETAVRRHIQVLIQQGFVASSLIHRKTGRPMKQYRLTEKASTDYFPTGYEELAARVLDTIYDTGGHKSVFEYLVSSNQVLAKKLSKKLENATIQERIEAIVEFFNSNGYMTDYRVLADGKYFLYHQNCAIYNLADKYRQLCFVELRLIEALSQSRVNRKQYIFKNQPVCGYVIAPKVEE